MSQTKSALLCTLILFGLQLGAAEQQPRQNSENRNTRDKRTVLTGVVDQVGDRFVLAGEDDIRPRAILRAEGFSPDNFARFVGHHVRVRGRVLTEGSETVLVVKSVENIERTESSSPEPSKSHKTK